MRTNLKTPEKTAIDFICDNPKNADCAKNIDTQINVTMNQNRATLSEIQDGIFCLSVPKSEHTSSLDLKKLCDQAQYILLPNSYDQEPFGKISWSSLRNWCFENPTPIPFAHYNQHCWLVFFYRLEYCEGILVEHLEQSNLSINEILTNRMIIVGNGVFEYPISLAHLISLAVFLNTPLRYIIEHEQKELLKKFELLDKLYPLLKKSFSECSWTLDQGKMSHTQQGLKVPVDYASIIDDLIYCGFRHDLQSYLNQFELDLLSLHSFFPTLTVRSLVHLKARPEVLALPQEGYALVAFKESLGKQIPIVHQKNSSSFAVWHKRARRHLFRHHYKARVVFVNESKNAFALVGEQIATIALFPELIRGVFDSLDLEAPKAVRLIAHNEDVLTIAHDTASWVDINQAGEKGSRVFRLVSHDGADALSLFQHVNLPNTGVGTFSLKKVPRNFFDLIDAALMPRHSMPQGHNHYLLGLAFECLHEWGLAAGEYKKSLRFDALDPDVLHALGSALMEIGNAQEAMPFLKRACALSPENPELSNDWGKSSLACGHINDAISAFENAVKLCPGSADYLNNLSNSYIHAQRLSDALAMLNKALRCDPHSSKALATLAFLHLHAGNEEEAKKNAMLAYKEDPTDNAVADLLWHLTIGKLSA